MLAWRFRDSIPIYLQIAEHLLMDIVSGKYAPGERIPSVREVATDAAVNPNTVQKAMSELEARGLITAQRTAGRFVTEDACAISNEREMIAQKITAEYLRGLARLGFGAKQATELIHITQNGKQEEGQMQK